MQFKGVELICPRCRGELDWTGPERAGIECADCGHAYPVQFGIPDLRIFSDPYIEAEADRAKAARLAAGYESLDLEGLIDSYYAMTPEVIPSQLKRFKSGLLSAESRARSALTGWERESGVGEGDRAGGRLLDLGCGTAALIVAARESYPKMVGVDIAFRWLVVARKRLEEAGLDAPLICACAEALPFPDHSFDCVAAESLLSHLRSQGEGIAETYRVTSPGGRLFVATPNKLSLGPDPHTGIIAGGLLPQGWVAARLSRQGGVAPKRRLLSPFDLARHLEAAGYEHIRLFPPEVTDEQGAHASSLERALIVGYRLASRLPPTRYLLRVLGPSLHAVARRRV